MSENFESAFRMIDAKLVESRELLSKTSLGNFIWESNREKDSELSKARLSDPEVSVLNSAQITVMDLPAGPETSKKATLSDQKHDKSDNLTFAKIGSDSRASVTHQYTKSPSRNHTGFVFDGSSEDGGPQLKGLGRRRSKLVKNGSEERPEELEIGNNLNSLYRVHSSTISKDTRNELLKEMEELRSEYILNDHDPPQDTETVIESNFSWIGTEKSDMTLIKRVSKRKNLTKNATIDSVEYTESEDEGHLAKFAKVKVKEERREILPHFPQPLQPFRRESSDLLNDSSTRVLSYWSNVFSKSFPKRRANWSSKRSVVKDTPNETDTQFVTQTEGGFVTDADIGNTPASKFRHRKSILPRTDIKSAEGRFLERSESRCLN